jgi:replicative DNA helicase
MIGTMISSETLYSPESEGGLIGALVLDQAMYWQVQGKVCETDFCDPQHQALYGLLSRQIESGGEIDIITALDLARGKDPKLAETLGVLCRSTPSAYNAATYARIIRDYSARRQARAVLEDAMAGLKNRLEIAEVLGDTSVSLEGIGAGLTGKTQTWQDIMQDAWAAIERTEARVKAGGMAGVPTGLRGIDHATGGIQGSRLWIIAGRPGVGKSALVLQWMVHAAKRGHAVGMCSLEMSSEEIAIRVMSQGYQVNASGLTFGSSRVVEISRAKRANGEAALSNLPMHIDDATYTLSGIEARITEWAHTQHIAYAVVDHIGLVSTGKDHNRNDQLGEVTRGLKRLAKRLGIPILALSQLSRNMEREKRHPMLCDLRDSGNIEQDADLCMFLYSPNDDETRETTEIEIGILKHRMGLKGWLKERYQFDGRIQSFKEML